MEIMEAMGDSAAGDRIEASCGGVDGQTDARKHERASLGVDRGGGGMGIRARDNMAARVRFGGFTGIFVLRGEAVGGDDEGVMGRVLVANVLFWVVGVVVEAREIAGACALEPLEIAGIGIIAEKGAKSGLG